MKDTLMPKIIHVQDVEKFDDVVGESVSILRRGGLLILPTETVYGIAALASNEDALQRLLLLKGRREGHAVPLAISGYEVLTEYIPMPGVLGQRLARRCWPGPLTLVFDGTATESQLVKYTPFIQKTIMPSGTVGLRTPNCPITLDILNELNEPIVLTSANVTGDAPAISAEEAMKKLDGRIDLVIDAGEPDFKKPSTVVRVEMDSVEILREGAITSATIEKLTAKIILFVCTGNTCRSPMAEILCEKLLAERLQSSPDELEDHGYVILSAGISASPFARANPMAQEVAKRYDMNLAAHESQQLTETLVRFADRIFVMSRGHREAILSNWPNVDTRLHVLRPDGGDIPDPIGGNYEVYQQCAAEIEYSIRAQLDLIAGI
jgi:protein-tyrosine phosphatase